MDAADARRTTSQAIQSAVLLELSEALAEAVTPDQVVATAARVAGDHLSPAFVGIGLRDERRGTLRYSDLPALPYPLAQTWRDISMHVESPGTVAARDGETVEFATIEEGVRRFPEAAPVIEAAGLPTRIATPLRTANGLLGSLVLGWKVENRVSDGERDLVMALARYVALAMERALLLEERQNVAAILQEALLTHLPTVPGTELGARYLAAAQSERVGGDWYDAVVREDGTTCLMVGDVCGHDIAAAAAMGQLRGMLRTMAYNREESPARLLGRLDTSARPLGVHQVATVALAQVSPPGPDGSSQVRWSSAGHPPPIVVQPSGEVEVWDDPPDLVIGIRPTSPRRTHSRTLPPGATLVLYSDGLVERRDRSVLAGLAELAEVLGPLARHPLGELLDLVVAALVAEQPEDDVALVGLRRLEGA